MREPCQTESLEMLYPGAVAFGCQKRIAKGWARPRM
jgi:hypothetical protein